jgi:hypothetical protein
VGFVEKMDESLFMMIIFFKVVYVGGDLAEKVAGRRNITEKREKIGHGLAEGWQRRRRLGLGFLREEERFSKKC